MFFENLPAGEYTLKLKDYGYTPNHSGTAHFAVTARGTQSLPELK